LDRFVAAFEFPNPKGFDFFAANPSSRSVDGALARLGPSGLKLEVAGGFIAELLVDVGTGSLRAIPEGNGM